MAQELDVLEDSSTDIAIDTPARAPLWTTRWFKVSAAVVGTLAIVVGYKLRTYDIRYRSRALVSANAELSRQIGEREKAEAALIESEMRYRRLFSSGNDTIVVHDLNEQGDGTRIVEVNDVLCKMLGYKRGELLQLTLRDIVASTHPTSYPDVPQDDGAHNLLESVYRARDGRDIPLEISARRFELDGKPAVLAVGRDITERKRAEKQRALLEGQLRQAQKMEAVGTLAGGIAHDFNNLLQGILGYSELAGRGLEPNDKRARDLEQVRLSALRARELTQQLLAFSRRQVLRPSVLNLNDTVAYSLKMLRRVIPENIALDFAPGEALDSVRADPGQLELVLLNLAVNARDAMEDGGRIAISTENILVTEEYVRDHPWARTGRFVQLSVSDDGRGMTKKTKRHVFEPFFTTNGVGKGTGLGLATVYGIVKQHDGMVTVSSEVDHGTVFRICLPSVDAKPGEQPENHDQSVPGGTETVLLAEDDKIVRELAARVLEEAGYTVLTVEDGAKALEIYAANRGQIDLVLLDVVMPKVGGHEVYEEIRKNGSSVKVLFCSGYSANGIHTQFVLDEGLFLLQKPYDPAVLLRMMRQVLDA